MLGADGGWKIEKGEGSEDPAHLRVGVLGDGPLIHVYPVMPLPLPFQPWTSVLLALGHFHPSVAHQPAPKTLDAPHGGETSLHVLLAGVTSPVFPSLNATICKYWHALKWCLPLAGLSKPSLQCS